MEADEVFLNGVRLGGEGHIGASLPESIAVYNKDACLPDSLWPVAHNAGQ